MASTYKAQSYTQVGAWPEGFERYSGRSRTLPNGRHNERRFVGEQCQFIVAQCTGVECCVCLFNDCIIM